MYFSLRRFHESEKGNSATNQPSISQAFAKIWKRTALIFLVGLLLNWFPFYNLNIADLRIFGVLQRIALAYGIAASISVLIKPTQYLKAAAVLLAVYWILLVVGGGEGAFTLEGNFKRLVDLTLIGERHMYGGFGIPFDPEGLIGCISTAANALFGAYAGYIISQNSDRNVAVKKLVLYGLGLVVAGLALKGIIPINKPLWTSSYASYTSGIAACALGVCIELIDIRKFDGWTKPFVQFGTNPLIVYVLSGVLVTMAIEIFNWTDAAGESQNLYSWLYSDVFSAIIPIPKLASLFFALFVVAVCWLFAAFLYRRKIFIKL